MYKLTDEDYKKAWDKNKITRSTLRARVYTYKWTVEKAINTPLTKKSNPYLRKARENGIQAQTYFTRVWRGWTKQDACSIPPLWVKKSKVAVLKNNNIQRKYDTINKCPYDYNLIYDTSICVKNGKCKECWESIKEVI